MNKPEKEILLAVLDKRFSQSGKEYFVGYMGLNTVYVSTTGDKMYISLQKWAKKEESHSDENVEEDVKF